MDVSDLVALVFRADWTQLSLSARISYTFDPSVAGRLADRRASESDRAMGPLRGAWLRPRIDYEDRSPVHSERSLLTAPGGRYRVENGVLVVGDGEHRWSVSGGVALPDQRHRLGWDLCELLTPRWLIAYYELQVIGTEVVGDRSAVRVTGAPRTAASRHHGTYHLLDSVDVLVDAELGILLASRQIFEGQTRESAELHNLVLNPPEAGLSGMFALPPGVRTEEEKEPFADYLPPTGAGWQIAGAVAGVAANALGFAIRHAPRRTPTWPTDDEEPIMPDAAKLAPEDWEDGRPPDDWVVNLLHRTGLPAPALIAEVHDWTDPTPSIQSFRMLQEKMPAPLQGVFGPDAVWEAFGDRVAEDRGGHRVARLAVRVPGRYRLDYVSGDWRKRYRAIACDGEHTTKLFADRVAIGPPKSLDSDLASMFDPAWLLADWRLAVIGLTRVADRDGVAIRAVATATLDGRCELLTRADLVVDLELGVLLRKTTYVNDQPATRIELRDLRPLDDSTNFRIMPGRGIRSVTDSGGPLGDLSLPGPAEAVATTATLAAAGAVAFAGWLEKHRIQRDRR
jgi:hypothetical protein